jgi:outer membrane protein OmpA-like peptidoglycan-associated protein
MKTKTMVLCTLALSLSACSAHNSMNNPSGPRYTPRPDVSQNNYTAENRAEDRRDTVDYNQYEQREPCQNYRKPPRSYTQGCESDVMPATVVAAVPKPHHEKIVSTYTVLFDFDKAVIRPDETATLDRAMREIGKYHPKEVTVTGYTDSHGKTDYNQTLSREREQAVSQALLMRGIKNQTLDREARGEFDQAVRTEDGVKNQENRRVVIDFRR